MIEAIIEKYGYREGLTIVAGKIRDWPYDEPKPTNTEFRGIVDSFKVKDGIQKIKDDCDELYKKLRRTFLINDGEIFEFDIEALLLFDSQVKSKADKIKVKEKGKKIKPLTKSKSVGLASKVNVYLEALSDAYNLDWDLIELEEYTMPNLNAIKTAQEALK